MKRLLAPLFPIRYKPGQLELFHEVHSSSLYGIKQNLFSGVDINQKDLLNGWTALHHASFLGNVKLVNFLADSGANLNYQDRNGISPLHLAAMNGHTKTILTLLRMGADPNLSDNMGKTPLDLCAKTPLKNKIKVYYNFDDVESPRKSYYTKLLTKSKPYYRQLKWLIKIQLITIIVRFLMVLLVELFAEHLKTLCKIISWKLDLSWVFQFHYLIYYIPEYPLIQSCIRIIIYTLKPIWDVFCSVNLSILMLVDNSIHSLGQLWDIRELSSRTFRLLVKGLKEILHWLLPAKILILIQRANVAVFGKSLNTYTDETALMFLALFICVIYISVLLGGYMFKLFIILSLTLSRRVPPAIPWISQDFTRTHLSLLNLDLFHHRAGAFVFIIGFFGLMALRFFKVLSSLIYNNLPKYP